MARARRAEWIRMKCQAIPIKTVNMGEIVPSKKRTSKIAFPAFGCLPISIVPAVSKSIKQFIKQMKQWQFLSSLFVFFCIKNNFVFLWIHVPDPRFLAHYLTREFVYHTNEWLHWLPSSWNQILSRGGGMVWAYSTASTSRCFFGIVMEQCGWYKTCIQNFHPPSHVSGRGLVFGEGRVCWCVISRWEATVKEMTRLLKGGGGTQDEITVCLMFVSEIALSTRMAYDPTKSTRMNQWWILHTTEKRARVYLPPSHLDHITMACVTPTEVNKENR